MINDSVVNERRSGQNRRKKRWQLCSKYFFTGRRENVRRIEDRKQSFCIDRHSAKIFAVILFVLLLSIIDAWFTFFLLGKGATEINPVMNYFLEFGPYTFFFAKYLLTSLSLIIILMNKNRFIFRTKFRSKIFFVIFSIPFALVIYWEIYLVLTFS